MDFYEVSVSDIRYQNSETLTYSGKTGIKIGSIVKVPYGNKSITGFVSAIVKKPKFKTKDIIEVISNTTLPTDLIKLHHWIKHYYPYGDGPATKLVLPSSFKDKAEEPKVNKLNTYLNSKNLTLTSDQKNAIKIIKETSNNSFLLHGVTGSGKTQIYLKLAKNCLKNNQSFILLVPEISLVSQTYNQFLELFGEISKVIHSGLTPKEHTENWMSIFKSNKPVILIGTRSAIFAPVKKLGMVVIDEMHEPAYKQDSAPRYNALRVAAKRIELSGAKIVYGSATPSITDYYVAEKLNKPIIEITNRALKANPVKKSIIDIKNKNLFSKHPYLSDELIDGIDKRLKINEQSLIFLNRRGTARQIICRDCGWQALCPKCDLPLTLHSDSHSLKCHTCGYNSKPIYSCPECGSSEIHYRSLGTKALYDALQNLFPEAVIKRFDTDNTKIESLAKNYELVRSGGVDIIVGTQMLGKGLDLPKLSFVGIVNGDMSLAMPDFSSAERNYQLVHQSIGRVGRGHTDGEVILQTFQPDNKLIKAAMDQDWKLLYKMELEERKKFNFPPFCYLLKITVSRKSNTTAENFINKLRKEIISYKLRIEVNEPTPSFYEKINGKYNWQMIIKSSNRQNLVEIIEKLPKGDYSYDIDPLNLL